MNIYHIWYKDFRSRAFKIIKAWSDTDLDDKLLDLSVQQKSVYLILKDGKVSEGMTGDQMMNIKPTIACPHCGGVDAHLPNCKGGYGL